MMSRHNGRTDGGCADGLTIAPLAVFRIGEVVKQGCDAYVGQALGDRLNRRMAHRRAGPVTEDEKVRRPRGPDDQAGDFSLLWRGDELYFGGFTYHTGAPCRIRLVGASGGFYSVVSKSMISLLCPAFKAMFARDHALRVGQPKFAAEIVGAMPRDPLRTEGRILPICFEKLLGVSAEGVQSGKRRQLMIHG